MHVCIYACLLAAGNKPSSIASCGTHYCCLYHDQLDQSICMHACLSSVVASRHGHDEAVLSTATKIQRSSFHWVPLLLWGWDLLRLWCAVALFATATHIHTSSMRLANQTK